MEESIDCFLSGIFIWKFCWGVDCLRERKLDMMVELWIGKRMGVLIVVFFEEGDDCVLICN